MSNKKLTAQEIDLALVTWRKIRRPGISYINIGKMNDGVVELIGTDGKILDDIAASLCVPGTPIRRTELPQPTQEDFAAIFERIKKEENITKSSTNDSVGIFFLVGILVGGAVIGLKKK